MNKNLLFPSIEEVPLKTEPDLYRILPHGHVFDRVHVATVTDKYCMQYDIYLTVSQHATVWVGYQVIYKGGRFGDSSMHWQKQEAFDNALESLKVHLEATEILTQEIIKGVYDEI